MTKRLLLEVSDDQFERWRREATLQGQTVTDWLDQQAEYQAHVATIQTLPLTIPDDPDLGSVCQENNLSQAFLSRPENQQIKERLLGKLYIMQVEAGTLPCDAGDKLVATLLRDNQWEHLGLTASELTTRHFVDLLHQNQIMTRVLTPNDTQCMNEAVVEADRRVAEALKTLDTHSL